MPLRRSQVHALDVIAYTGDQVAARAARLLGHVRPVDRGGARRPLHDAPADGGRAVPGRGGRPGPAVSVAEALGAAAAARRSSGSRTAVRAQVLALEERGRRGGAAAGRPTRGRRTELNVARQPAELERRPRAVAIGVFDGVHLGHRAVVAEVLGRGLVPTVVTFDPHPREVLGYGVELLATLERRLELLAELGVEETLVVEFTPELAALDARGVRRGQRARDRGRARRRRRRDSASAPAASGDLETFERLGVETRAGRARPGRLVDARSAS